MALAQMSSSKYITLKVIFACAYVLAYMEKSAKREIIRILFDKSLENISMKI